MRKAHNLDESFKKAYSGLIYIFKTQRNARLIGLLAIFCISLGIYFGISLSELLLLIITIALVITTEVFNTLVEEVANLVTEETHPKIRLIKDISAGAVLISCIMSLIVGAIVFFPRIFSFK
jgi:diacylglycerol kinase (ATP)